MQTKKLQAKWHYCAFSIFLAPDWFVLELQRHSCRNNWLPYNDDIVDNDDKNDVIYRHERRMEFPPPPLRNHSSRRFERFLEPWVVGSEHKFVSLPRGGRRGGGGLSVSYTASLKINSQYWFITKERTYIVAILFPASPVNRYQSSFHALRLSDFFVSLLNPAARSAARRVR